MILEQLYCDAHIMAYPRICNVLLCNVTWFSCDGCDGHDDGHDDGGQQIMVSLHHPLCTY